MAAKEKSTGCMGNGIPKSRIEREGNQRRLDLTRKTKNNKKLDEKRVTFEKEVVEIPDTGENRVRLEKVEDIGKEMKEIKNV